jgi:hypothetical protein
VVEKRGGTVLLENGGSQNDRKPIRKVSERAHHSDFRAEVIRSDPTKRGYPGTMTLALNLQCPLTLTRQQPTHLRLFEAPD